MKRREFVASLAAVPLGAAAFVMSGSQEDSLARTLRELHEACAKCVPEPPHVNSALTEMSLAYLNGGLPFISGKVFP